MGYTGVEGLIDHLRYRSSKGVHKREDAFFSLSTTNSRFQTKKKECMIL